MVSEVIMTQLKMQGKTKQWLAGKMNLSYSTLHQKLSNNTFTAEELIELCRIFSLSLEDFVENDEDRQKDLSLFPIENREDVAISERRNYVRAGMHVESQHAAGALIYLPYGITDYLAKYGPILILAIDAYIEALKEEVECITIWEQGKKPKLEDMQSRLHIIKELLLIQIELYEELYE